MGIIGKHGSSSHGMHSTEWRHGLLFLQNHGKEEKTKHPGRENIPSWEADVGVEYEELN